MKKWHYLSLAIGGVIAIGFFIIQHRQSEMEKFSRRTSTVKTVVETAPSAPQLPCNYCPAASNLQKQQLIWQTRDQRWRSYTPSTASKVVSFIGAQWVGVKIGKVICLYQTDEEVAFPLALEPTQNQPVPEPNGNGWSALIENRKLCKSANTADCPYQIQSNTVPTDLYGEIKYVRKSAS